MVEAVTEFTEVWDAMTYKERTDVVRCIVERVEFDGSEVSITFAEDAPHAR